MECKFCQLNTFDYPDTTKHFVSDDCCYHCANPANADKIKDRLEKNKIFKKLSYVKEKLGRSKFKNSEKNIFIANSLIDNDFKCEYCLEAITGDNISIDHRNAKARFEEVENFNNYAVVCTGCNKLKLCMTEEEFLNLLQSDIPTTVPTILEAQNRYNKNHNRVVKIKDICRDENMSFEVVVEQNSYTVNTKNHISVWKIGDRVVEVLKDDYSSIRTGIITSIMTGKNKGLVLIDNSIMMRPVTRRSCSLFNDRKETKWFLEKEISLGSQYFENIFSSEKIKYREMFIKKAR